MSYFLPKNQSNPLDFFLKISYNILMSKVYYGEDNIKPDFSSSKNSDNDSAVFRNQIAQSGSGSSSTGSSQSALQSLENSSAVANSETNSLANLRDLEQKSFYTGSGNFQNQNQLSGKEKVKKLKKYSPLIGLIVILFGGLFGLIFGISNIANHIETLITRATDTMFGTYSATSLQMTKEYMQKKHGKFPDYLKQRLAKNNIIVEDNGEEYILKYRNKIITAENLKSTYNSDISFQNDFTKSKHGRGANYFDPAAILAFKGINVSRNFYRSFKNTMDDKANQDSLKKTNVEQFKDSGAEGRYAEDREKETETEENGNKKPETETEENGNKKTETVTEVEEVKSTETDTDSPSTGPNSDIVEEETAKLKTANSRAENFINKMSAVSGKVRNTCAVMRVANIISLLVAAHNIITSASRSFRDLEPYSKTRAGNGAESPMNSVQNEKSISQKTTYINTDTGKETPIEGAQLQAQGAYAVLAGSTAMLSQTKHYAIENIFNSVKMGIATSTTANIGCTVANFAASVVDFASDAVAAITAIPTGGASLVVGTVLKKFAVHTAVSLGIAAIISSGLSVLIPYVAKTIMSNPELVMKGIPAGEELIKGSSLSAGFMAMSTIGLGVASKKTAQAYSQELVLAANEEAKLDRYNHSPFDASNSNTFLGNLATKFSYLHFNNNLLKNLSTFSSSTSRSASTLSDIASAKTFASSTQVVSTVYDSNKDAKNFYDQQQDPKVCERLSSIGGACNMYGAHITASDPSLKNLDEDDATYQSILSENTTEKDGKRTVKEDSILDKKIKYCDNRKSPFGVFDQNILDAESPVDANSFISSIPLIGSFVNMINSGYQSLSSESKNWATGKNCVMDESNPMYQKIRYLQKYTERNRICTQTKCEDNLDSTGNLQDPILAVAEKYQKKQQSDKSLAGQLAVYSGLRKSDAEFGLAVIDYYKYLAEHQPPQTLADILMKPVKTFITGESLYRSTLASQITHLKKDIDSKSNQEKGTKYTLDYKFRFQTSLV